MRLTLHYRDDLGGLEFQVEVDTDAEGRWHLRQPYDAPLAGRQRVELAPGDLPVGAPRGDAFLVVEVDE